MAVDFSSVLSESLCLVPLVLRPSAARPMSNIRIRAESQTRTGAREQGLSLIAASSLMERMMLVEFADANV